MSHPAIGIGHPVSDPTARGSHVPLMCAPQPRDLMVRYSGFCICHTEFGIRKSRIGNREIRNHGAVE
jgi:hypothetical protein